MFYNMQQNIINTLILLAGFLVVNVASQTSYVGTKPISMYSVDKDGSSANGSPNLDMLCWEEGTIDNIRGHGKATRAADMSTLEVTISVTEPTVAAAWNRTSIGSENVISVVNSTETNDFVTFKTSRLRIEPEYKWDRTMDTNNLTGYTVSTSITVEVTDISELQGIVGEVTAMGSDDVQVTGPQYALQPDTMEVYETMARKRSVSAAVTKAELYASALGGKLGKLIRLSETPVEAPRPGMGMFANDASPMMARGVGGGAPMAPSVPLVAGNITVDAYAYVTFQFMKCQS